MNARIRRTASGSRRRAWFQVIAAVALAWASVQPGAFAVPALAAPAVSAPADDATPKPEEFVVAFDVLDLQFDPHRSIYSAEAQIFTAADQGLFSTTPTPSTPSMPRAALQSLGGRQDLYLLYSRRGSLVRRLAPPGQGLQGRMAAGPRSEDEGRRRGILRYHRGGSRLPYGQDRRPRVRGDICNLGQDSPGEAGDQGRLIHALLCHHSFSPIHGKGILRRRGFPKESIRGEVYWAPRKEAS